MPPKILPPEGIQVLRDSFDSGNINLSKSQRADLLKKIHDMGHTWYTEDALNDWFHSARKTRESDSIEKSASAAKPIIQHGRRRSKSERLSQYPSIRLSHLSNLQVLASASPNPSKEVIKIWADLTGSDPSDVANWVRNYHPSQGESDYRTTADQDLDAEEESEEEVDEGEEGEEEEEEEDELLSQESASQVNPTPHRNFAHYPSPSLQPVDSKVLLPHQENLLLAISKSLSLSSEEPPLPRSSSQFDDLFAPYETMMKYLIENQNWRSR